MTNARVRLLAALLVLAAGCDAVAKSGETLVAANGGTIWAFNTPNAVEVRPDGTLIVQDASLFGLGKLIEKLPMGAFPTPGAAIEANRGTVRIQKGRIAGGSIVLRIDPSTIPVPPLAATPGDPFVDLVGLPRESLAPLASALSASDSRVEIEGGTLISSSVIGQPNPYLATGATVSVFRGQLRIRGGELLRGTMMPPSPIPFTGQSLLAFSATVEISGGDFEGMVSLAGSRATITGGRFAAGIVISTLVTIDNGGFPRLPGVPGLPPRLTPCYEIRGGSIPSLGTTGTDPIFIFGSGFNLPLGLVAIPAPSNGALFSTLALTGVLADGSPLQLMLSVSPATPVVLAAPGDPGCGS